MPTWMAEWITTGLVHGTVLAAITALAAFTVLRRARPALLAALWTVVLLKFLIPIGPRTPLSLSTVLDGAISRATEPAAEHAAFTAHAAAPVATGQTDLVGWALLAAYAAGLAWTVARRASRNRALRRCVRALALAPPAMTERLARLAAGIGRGPRRLPLLRLSADAPAPYLVGCLRPQLVVPAWLDPAAPAWAAAMTHELAHLARRDPWMRALESAVADLFFFWPPVAWVCRRIDRAREMACDQWAVSRGPLPARDYAGLLVALATRGRSSLAPAAIPLVRGRSQLAARVDQLLAGARPPALGRARAALVAVWAALCLGGAARASGAVSLDGEECALEPEVMAQILASHPGADADGDGLLSQDEACAHQQRMRRLLLDRVVDAELVSRLDPAADTDGDGALSDVEIDSIKEQFELQMAPDRADVVLHFAGAPVPLPEQQVRVSAAASAARVCRAARCTDASTVAPPPGRFPLLIDVSLSTTQE
jgi:beta-lactamase regulating signal transducer with metallopeptidase domain